MKFRPCIDIHQGKVKQIVGETLQQDASRVVENFVSSQSPGYYARMYREDRLTGGHIIMLGGGNEEAAEEALRAYPGGLQIGGGIKADNAARYIELGASHVIVTSYIFQDGKLQMDNLDAIAAKVGKDRLVIDLSCKERDGKYYVVTNQWRTFSDFEVNAAGIAQLEAYCDEFLIHAVDVEGKREGVQERLAAQLAEWTTIPTTYAGGARSLADLERFRSITGGRLDITIGSALDIFGGQLPYRDVVEFCRAGTE
ncbi:phosphoribosylformimino-5-aminoimidazole carboxamide ribotide isomerase [Paenibacillus contaminans]|uniref:Phosphoribosylformimino-5-aminoimidazole carboxamide ribotide isomerase n=1 Tax=Paenibacillus contaminans TaxID=450362 RepID=A0A329LP97_9BACL|nr:phosphoribosylformimino-5-aminoimidazole carboxamide ribotide isomerase [Paenibacillus contaminans]RAV09050.1 phosphoribosylformimino-5-aminoimidazole carboxamide ribotide isomerase [Paenibacillus contaminans]